MRVSPEPQEKEVVLDLIKKEPYKQHQVLILRVFSYLKETLTFMNNSVKALREEV